MGRRRSSEALSDEQVIKILSSDLSNVILAQRWGMSRDFIEDLRAGKVRQDVTRKWKNEDCAK